MNNGGKNSTVRDLQTLFSVGAVGGLADGELLDRFIARREEAVFQAIIHRHGPMVWGVCRRVLRDHHDAEDAFQATFLVLARKASSVSPREMLPNWLYGVAYQTSRKAGTLSMKRRRREIPTPNLPEPEPVRRDQADDLLEQLDRELIRLPDKYRVPILLCEMEGMSHREAAEQLGWPIGTVSGRLSRAKAILAKRLLRKDATFSMGSLTVVLARDANAGAPPALLDSTTRAVALSVMGRATAVGVVSANVSLLTQGVLKTMLTAKLMMIMAICLACVALAAGGTVLAFRADSEARTKIAQEDQDGFQQDQSHVTDIQKVKEPAQSEGETADDNEEPKSALPRNVGSHFGGGADEPRYMRQDNLFFVISPVGDKFSIYDARTKRAKSLRLPGTKNAPMEVLPILGDDLICLHLKGPKIARIQVFSIKDWKWYGQDLKEPVQADSAQVTANGSVAEYTQGHTVYAFSNQTKRWNILELPEKFPTPANIQVSMNSIVLDHDGHVYQFSGKTGEWTHTDLRAQINAAIEAEEKSKDPASTTP